MPKFVSLLRGINISGQKIIRMGDLKLLCKGCGFSDVETYVQSGNVIFTASGKADVHSKKIQDAIQRQYGFEVSVLVISAKDFTKIASSNPFFKGRDVEASTLYVTFLFDKPKVDFASIDLPKSGDEDVALHGGQIYFYGPLGYGRTKLNNNYFERALKVSATTRNWKTVQALKAMLPDKL